MSAIEIRRALVSVYDKTGLDELARGLHEAGVEIVSTGSTAAAIAGTGVPVTRVEDLTGFPECLDGRVKTLHPRVHAGLLADLGNSQHVAQLAGLRIEAFQLLVSNLYPFEAAVSSGAPPEQCVEEIDIGGPAMVRAAAKNHASVAVVTSPLQYAEVLAALRGGGFTLAQRQRLAASAFALTARESRLNQVEEAVRDGQETVGGIADRLYGPFDERIRRMIEATVRAHLLYLRDRRRLSRPVRIDG